jgi:hypothetical protein
VSFDLFQDETAARLSSMRGVMRPEASIWDNFFPGTGKVFMRGMAETGRAIDLAGSVGPIIQDAIAGGTENQDRYFKEHEEVFQRAVDYWTPRPEEVGAAGEIAGQLLSILPLVIAAPSAAVAKTQLSTAEDLAHKGVSSGKAQAVGAVQGAGLGLGVWMPILGQNLFQRMVVGGAGFNVLQGAVTRGVSGSILEGTKAADDFKAFDWSAVTLDALLGLAFGGLAHLSPKQRAQGENAWKRIHEFISSAKPSDLEALAALRQGEHLNSESLPGKPAEATDLNTHAEAMRKAIEDLVHGRPVDVQSILAGARFLPDDARAKLQERAAEDLSKQARTLLHQDMELQAARRGAEETPGFLQTAEQKLALREPTDIPNAHPDVAKAIEIARKPGFERTASEKLLLDSMLAGRAGDYLLPELQTKGPSAARDGGTPPDVSGEPTGPAAHSGERERVDPVAIEAERFVSENPDRQITVGKDADGKPITQSVRQYLDNARETAAFARNDAATVFQAAAQCLLGGGR